MARTDLFRALKRIARNAARSSAPERDPNAAPVTRRQVLQGGAALAGAGLIARAGAQQVRTRDKVVIIGAGTAGLVAAHRLKQAGVMAELYEASSRVGGRMFSGYDLFGGGEVIEWGGELIDTEHVRMQALAKELGLSLIDLAAYGEARKLEEDRWFWKGQRFSEAQVEAAFAPLIPRLREAYDTLSEELDYQNLNAAGRFLDALSISEWLERVDAPQPIRGMLELAYTTEFGLEPGEQSALNLITMIGWEDEEGEPDFAVYGTSDERYRIREGSGAMPTRLARGVNAQIQTGVPMVALEQVGSRYRITFQSGVSVDAEHVILALPFSTLRDVDLKVPLPAVKRRAIRELGYGTNTKLFFGFREAVWEDRHRSSGSTYTDLGYQTTWDTTRGQGARGGVIVNFTGGKHGLAVGAGRPSDQAAGFLEGFERVHPGSRAAYTGVAQRFYWPDKAWMKGSYQCYRPGQYGAFSGAEGARVGRLYFCGEHTSLEAPGYMEGAVETGERVAREVLALVRRA